MAGINSRSKGARGEKMAVKLLETWTGKKFARTPASGGLQWKSSMAKGDAVCTVEGHYYPFCNEIKFYENLNFQHLLYLPDCDIIKFWNQCQRDAKECSKCPMLLMRYNGLPKDFFFIGIPPKIYYLYFQKALKRPVTFHIEALDLMIFTTPDLLRVNYKKIRKDIKYHFKPKSK